MTKRTVMVEFISADDTERDVFGFDVCKAYRNFRRRETRRALRATSDQATLPLFVASSWCRVSWRVRAELLRMLRANPEAALAVFVTPTELCFNVAVEGQASTEQQRHTMDEQVHVMRAMAFGQAGNA